MCENKSIKKRSHYFGKASFSLIAFYVFYYLEVLLNSLIISLTVISIIDINAYKAKMQPNVINMP